jgi:hypothetical protein
VLETGGTGGAISRRVMVIYYTNRPSFGCTCTTFPKVMQCIFIRSKERRGKLSSPSSVVVLFVRQSTFGIRVLYPRGTTGIPMHTAPLCMLIVTLVGRLKNYIWRSGSSRFFICPSSSARVMTRQNMRLL